MVFATHDEVNKVLKDKGLDVVAVMNADDIHSGDMMKMLVHRSTIWRTFVIMALISLLIEILVLRFWK